MTPEQALKLLDSTVAQMECKRELTILLMQATQVIQKLIDSTKEPNNGKAVPSKPKSAN